MVFFTTGSNAIQVTAMFAQKSLTATHVEVDEVISLLYHKPPVTPPAQTFFLLLSFGSNNKALVLPPTLLGPLSVHLLEVELPGAAPAFVLFPCIILNTGHSLSDIGLPVFGSAVLKNSCSQAKSGRSCLFMAFNSALEMCFRLL